MLVKEKKSIRLDSDVAIATNEEDVTIVTTFEIDGDEAACTSIPFEIGMHGEIVKFEMVSDGQLVEVELPIKAPKEEDWNEPAQALYISCSGESSMERLEMPISKWRISHATSGSDVA